MSDPSSSLSQGQLLALRQLKAIAEAGEAVELLAVPAVADAAGYLTVELSLDCAGTVHRSDGIQLRNRERFRIWITSDFPFEPPSIWVPHRRWAGTPHVQWGSHLCVYAAPSIEWNPSDGMRGLVDRLALWLEHASLGELDPDDQPLHPPVAYTSSATGVVVVRADVGELAPKPRPVARGPQSRTGAGSRVGEVRVVAALAQWDHLPRRVDVVEWITIDELRDRHAGAASGLESGTLAALGLLSDGEMDFEYPTTAASLVSNLEARGLQRAEMLEALGQVTVVNAARIASSDEPPSPLYVFVGTPSRRDLENRLRQHLVCWRLDELGRDISDLIGATTGSGAARADLHDQVIELANRWIGISTTSWVRVLEAREEVTIRRDTGTAADRVRNKRILLLGAGALGGPIAEFCVRAGARSVSVVDNGTVTPGILVRQPYADREIGWMKATALADRLNQLRRDAPVLPIPDSAQSSVLARDGIPAVDLIIDATANASIASLIELRRSRARDEWPPIMSVAVGHDARRGIVTASDTGATGAGRDILRRLPLAAESSADGHLRDVLADFFPNEPRSRLFQPEPGCSEPTFVGSASDLAALAGQLFDAGFHLLHDLPRDARMAAAVVRLGDVTQAQSGPTSTLSWRNDLVAMDRDAGLEVRVSDRALSEIRAECRRGARVRGPEVETGGLLLGEFDEACGVLWVDVATGPPPDSRLSAEYFEHGVEGVEPLIAHHRRRSQGRTTFVGMWHSHPFGRAAPSETDDIGMRDLVMPVANAPSRALLMIVGGRADKWLGFRDAAGDPDVFVSLIAGTHSNYPRGRKLTRVIAGRFWTGGWTDSPDAGVADRAPVHRSWLRRLLRTRQ